MLNVLKGMDGRIFNDQDSMAPIAEQYFQEIFRTSNPQSIAQVVENVRNTVTPVLNSALLQNFIEKEVHEALFQMHQTKAPGSDGMNALFFQKFWHIIGHDISNAVLDFLHSGQMLKSINFTHISLIPKITNPDRMSQFRPISLCNVLYKIISKVLAIRLKQVLTHVIFDTQSAFVPGRLITDNILVAFNHCIS
jgi:hypothetical protein